MTAALRPLLDLHPSLWTGQHWSRPADACLPSGFAELDAELPGGGWPRGSLVELLAPRDSSALSLLLPVLNALETDRLRVLVAPPYQPVHQAWRSPPPASDPDPAQAPGKAAHSDSSPCPPRLLWIRSRQVSDTLWASAQALRHGYCGAVLAWLPAQVPLAALRQLQLLASQGDSLFFCLRPAGALLPASPALLRLQLETRQDAQGRAWLDVHIRKRRGPPYPRPICLRPQDIAAGSISTPATPRHVPLAMPAPVRQQHLA